MESYWALVRSRDPVPEQATIGEKYKRAMEVKTKPEADREFERLVEHTMRTFGRTRQDAEKVERTNLGYYSGYFSVEVQARVERLFGAAHPIFGSVSNEKQLSPNEILQLGLRLGERANRNEPVFCEHANENPGQCPCDPGCYCKDNNTCRGR